MPLALALIATALAGPLRDPFAPLAPHLVDPPSATRAVQRWEVGEYELVGVALDPAGGDRALVRDPAGGTHVLAEGDYLGRRWGMVRVIRDGRIEVVEEAVTLTGELQVETRVLALPL